MATYLETEIELDALTFVISGTRQRYVGHEDREIGPSWYWEDVTITDIKTRGKSIFKDDAARKIAMRDSMCIALEDALQEIFERTLEEDYDG